MKLFVIKRWTIRRRGNMGYLPPPLLGNSKDVFGHVCSKTKGFERKRGDTPSFDRLSSFERGDAQESKSVILRGMRGENVLAENHGGSPARKRVRG